jgi:hypothetical protein
VRGEGRGFTAKVVQVEGHDSDVLTCSDQVLIIIDGAIPPLIKCLGSTTPGVQKHAARALSSLAADTDEAVSIMFTVELIMFTVELIDCPLV